METTYTTDTTGASVKIVVAIDLQTAAILAGALFVGLLGALFIYNYLPKK